MSKRKRKHVNIPPATILRPRLDKLWADEALLHKEKDAIEGDLDVLARDVSSDLLVKTMLRAYQAASEAAQDRLDGVLPRWLDRSGHAESLKELAAAQSLGPGLRPLALRWLKAAGTDIADLESRPSLFLSAYYFDDAALLGRKSQASAGVFWYTSPKKNRAQGLGFLLDYNPPWDGAVKDVLVTPRRHPKSLIEKIQDVWRSGGMESEPIGPERAKTIILTALNCNREAEIRLPRDMIKARDLFERYVLSLPGATDTPAFTMEDFDFLAHNGERPEKIRRFEQTVGRRVRLEDGEEILVMGGPDWEDEEW